MIGMSTCEVFLCTKDARGDALALAHSEDALSVEHLVCDEHRALIAHGFNWASAVDTGRVLFIGNQVDEE
jgi:hypothetical protein